MFYIEAEKETESRVLYHSTVTYLRGFGASALHQKRVKLDVTWS